MARSTATVAAEVRKNLDPAFHGWGALLDALGAALSNAEGLAEGLASLTSIGGAGGESDLEAAMLDLVGWAEGFDRIPGETNASYRERIRAGALGSDVVSLDRAVTALLAEIAPSLRAYTLVVEHHDARFYCDDDPTEHLHDFFLDGLNLLGVTRGVSIVVWDYEPADDVKDALLALMNAWRAAGVRCWLVYGIDVGGGTGVSPPVLGFPWATP